MTKVRYILVGMLPKPPEGDNPNRKRRPAYVTQCIVVLAKSSTLSEMWLLFEEHFDKTGGVLEVIDLESGDAKGEDPDGWQVWE